MQEIVIWIVGGVLAYLLGSVPFGFLIGKALGRDIRRLGSGNIGATNVFRSVGKKAGVLTFALDVGKGLSGVLLLPALASAVAGVAHAGSGVPLFCGAMTIAGHNWSCFLGFRGGKGIATSAGMLIGLAPLCVGIAFLAWLAVFLTLRYVSLASIVACLVLAVAVWPLQPGGDGIWVPLTLTLLALVGIWKHRGNIARLRAGSESRFEFGRRRSAGTQSVNREGNE